MKKIVTATFLISFTAGVVVGWAFLPQPKWLYDFYGSAILKITDKP